MRAARVGPAPFKTNENKRKQDKTCLRSDTEQRPLAPCLLAAAVTVGDTRRGRMSGLVGRVGSPGSGGGGGMREAWKSDIVRQLKRRDRDQHDRFQDLIRICTSEIS